MAVKDHEQFFEGVQVAPTPTANRVPNTVSRAAKTGDRALLSVIAESGKPVLDAELNLNQDAKWMGDYLLRRWHTPSGWLRGSTHLDAYCDWTLGAAPVGLVDDSGGTHIHADDTLLDAVILPRLEATVAGHGVVVEYTNTRTAGYNLITLAPASVYDGGIPSTVKRTDFIFLEVWRTLVAPSPRASAQLQVVDNGDLAPGDQILINGLPLTAKAAGPLVGDDFIIGVDASTTAANIVAAINLVTNSFATICAARNTTDMVFLTAVLPGAGSAAPPPPTGNFITLSVVVAVVGSLVVSGATFTGGADRPNKPADDQSKIYRHGNVLSPSPVWLDDELVDPIIGLESSQRIQVQYRIRVTDNSEGVNYKTHPDGFSNRLAGPGPSANGIYAQASRNVPVWTGDGEGDTRSYPFVPADGSSTWLESSAAAFGFTDDGLFVAGDGTERSAQDLGAIDGFVFAIPIGFVHRHNDASNVAAVPKGFDPQNNANGAPTYDHPGYVSWWGAVPAGASDRPDGEFCNVVTTNGILDLRRHVVPSGLNLAAELQYQMQSLLDGSIRTWSVDTTSKQDLGGDSGDVSTRFLICNEIGRSNTSGGVPPISGDTQRGPLIRSYDHLARRFGAQPVVERVVVAFWPGDRDAPAAVPPGTVNPARYVKPALDGGGAPKNAGQWYEGDVLHLDLEFLNSTTLGGLFDARPGAGDGGGGSGIGLPSQNFLAFAPVGTVITDVLRVMHDDGNYNVAQNQNVQMGIVKGLGTTHLEVTLDANDTPVTGGLNVATTRMVGRDQGVGVWDTEGSARRIFLEIELTYPIGVGTTDTPDHEIVPDTLVYSDSVAKPTGPGPCIENDMGQRPADFEKLLPPRLRTGFREIQHEYITNDTIAHGAPLAGSPVGLVTTEQLVSRSNLALAFPRRLWGDRGATGMYVEDAVDLVAREVSDVLTEFGSSSRTAVLTGVPAPLSGAGQTLCTVRYFAQDPIPNYGVNGGGYQVGYYFRSNAPQTAGTHEGDIKSTGGGTLPTTLQVEPLLTSPTVWTGQRGMGGHELAFPYASPLDQIPIHDGTTIPAGPDFVAGTTEEWFFAATAEVAIDDFSADTGLLVLHAFVQQDVQNILTFGGPDNTEYPRKDAEFRAFYPFADDTAYRPTVLAQPLYGATRHKAFTPFLARAVADVPGVNGGLLFRKSELLLVVLSRFAELDDENTVRFIDPVGDNRTLAAVYRTRNLLLTVGDRTCLGT